MENLAKKGMSDMSATAQDLMRGYAVDAWPRDNHKSRIWRLARKLQWGHRRTRALYNNEHGTRVGAAEMAALQQLKLVEARNEYTELKDRIARLETALAVIDPDFHSPTIDALGQSHGGRGGMDRARTDGGVK